MLGSSNWKNANRAILNSFKDTISTGNLTWIARAIYQQEQRLQHLLRKFEKNQLKRTMKNWANSNGETIEKVMKNDDEKAATIFQSVMKKLPFKKKEIGAKPALRTSAVSLFFNYGKSSPKRTPGSIHRIENGQFPPVWVDSNEAESKSPMKAAASVAKILSPVEKAKNDELYAKLTRRKSDGEMDRLAKTRAENFAQLLGSDLISMAALRELCWNGIPMQFRPMAWQLLLGYMPLNKERRQHILKRKREEYVECVRTLYDIKDDSRGDSNLKTLRQIVADIPRSSPTDKVFKDAIVQKMMERVLYIWALRHTASGYVQGINDILTPFILLLLSQHVDNPYECDVKAIEPSVLTMVEADSYWCLAKLLDGIQDHYTFAQPGLQRMVYTLEEVVRRCDVSLHMHLKEQGLEYMHFAFRWMNCLLMREIPLPAILRLWDTYLSQDGGFERFHIYTCVALIMFHKQDLMAMDFQEMFLFLQDLPTKNWTEYKVELILAQGYVLQESFQATPSHLPGVHAE